MRANSSALTLPLVWQSAAVPLNVAHFPCGYGSRLSFSFLRSLDRCQTPVECLNPCAGATVGPLASPGCYVPLGWNRAYSGSGAAAHGCWSAGVLVRESSETQFRWPAILTGFRRPAATVFVLEPSFWWLCTKQPDGGFSYVDGDYAAVGSLGG